MVEMLFRGTHERGGMSSRVVTRQYSNGLFGPFDTFELSKQTLFIQSVKQTDLRVCSVVSQIRCRSIESVVRRGHHHRRVVDAFVPRDALR